MFWGIGLMPAAVKNFFPLLGVLVFFVFQAVLNVQLRTLEVAWVAPIDETQRRWDPRVFRVLSFGHLPSTVDWLWIQALSDTSLTRYPAGVHSKFYYDLDLLTDLDPAFFQAYAAGANLLAVIRDDGIGSRDLVLKGIRFSKSGLLQYPDSFRKRHWEGAWQLSVLLAYIYLFELKDLPNAAVAFQEAAALPQVPEYVQKLARRLEVRGGIYEVGLNLLAFMMEQAENEKSKERLAGQLKSLQVAHFLFLLNEEFAQFKSSRKTLVSSQVASPDFGSDFLKQRAGGARDPWGGVLSFEKTTGRIATSTSHEKVFGLE
jgi:hypothetical protein